MTLLHQVQKTKETDLHYQNATNHSILWSLICH